MDLPINDKELATIVSSLRLGGDVALYQKMNTPSNRFGILILMDLTKKLYANNMGWQSNGKSNQSQVLF
jgi:hypothetical protein